MVGELKCAAAQYRDKAWAKSTQSTYRIHMQCYVNFCASIKCEAVPASSTVLQLYVTYLAKIRRLRYCTIQQYLNIVTHMHKMVGLADPVYNDYQLKHVLLGIKRELGTAQTPVGAITPQQLLKVKSTLNFANLSDLTFWCACLIAFYGLLRPGNITTNGTFDADKDIRRIDLFPYSWGYLLCLRRTKTIQFREKRVEIILPRTGNELCPVTAQRDLLQLTGVTDPHGSLLILEGGSPLSYRYFCDKLRHSLALVGEDHLNIRAHSFRRGGASWLARLGVPTDMIKSIGYWASDAVFRYIDSDFSQKLAVAKKFGGSLC